VHTLTWAFSDEEEWLSGGAVGLREWGWCQLRQHVQQSTVTSSSLAHFRNASFTGQQRNRDEARKKNGIEVITIIYVSCCGHPLQINTLISEGFCIFHWGQLTPMATRQLRPCKVVHASEKTSM
jgi:hypothetical protein